MRIACRNLNLDIKAPLSKSVYHRELIINYLLGARGSFLEESPDDNDDIRATKACLRALENNDSDTVVLNCNESGSTLRFMIPVALSCKSEKVKTLVFKTKGRLIERPIKELADCLAHGKYRARSICYRRLGFFAVYLRAPHGAVLL